MELKLDRKLTALVQRKVRPGQYASAEDVVASGLGSLIADERFGDFAAGELDALIDEGEASIAANGTLDGEKAYLQRKRWQARRRGFCIAKPDTRKRLFRSGAHRVSNG
ncbi:MAG: hypothetical protein ACKVS9_09290 [Phycisphaerae bacterium]